MSDVIKALEWVIQDVKSAGTVGKSLVTMSLGEGGSHSLNAAAAAVTAAGIPLFVAAGNDSADSCQDSPGSEPSVINGASSFILKTLPAAR